MIKYQIADVIFLSFCLVGAAYAGARAAEPVETEGWEGVKEALEQVQQAKEPGEMLPLICHQPLDIQEEGEEVVTMTALYWQRGGELTLIASSISYTLEQAIEASTEPLPPLDPSAVPVCSAVVVESP
jgi:hypothetical protein